MEFYNDESLVSRATSCPEDTYYGCTCEEDIPEEWLNCDDDSN